MAKKSCCLYLLIFGLLGVLICRFARFFAKTTKLTVGIVSACFLMNFAT